MQLAQDKKNKNLIEDANYTKFIRFAKVTKVYDASSLGKNYGEVELVWLDSQDHVNGTVSFLKSGYSTIHGSGIVVMPSVGDIVGCLAVQGAGPIIIGFISQQQILAVLGSTQNTNIPGTIRPLFSGEVLVKSRAQSEIYLKKDGGISIICRDANKATQVVNTDTLLNTEPLLEKTMCSSENVQVEMHLGVQGLTENLRQVGCSPSIFQIAAHTTTQQSVELQATAGHLTYVLPVDDTATIAEIDRVDILVKNPDGTEDFKKTVSGASIELFTQYVYLPQQDMINGQTESPCTLDSNRVITSITLPTNVSGLVKKGTILRVVYFTKSVLAGLEINKTGDVFIDGRNLVFRSSQKKACLGLFDSSKIVASSKQVELGDKLGGYVETTPGGITLSAGKFKTAEIAQYVADNASCLGPVQYFYILDNYPLIAYTAETQEYRIVGLSEYVGLSSDIRYNIRPRSFDLEDSAEGAFTRNKLVSLIQSSTEPVQSYGELRTGAV
jgi:hypothetical protein